jgi:hypothetical protein
MAVGFGLGFRRLSGTHQRQKSDENEQRAGASTHDHELAVVDCRRPVLRRAAKSASPSNAKMVDGLLCPHVKR